MVKSLELFCSTSEEDDLISEDIIRHGLPHLIESAVHKLMFRVEFQCANVYRGAHRCRAVNTSINIWQ